MQAQVEATEKLLSAEQASNANLRSQSTALSTELSSVKSELADTAQQLDAERSISAELKDQLEAIKSEYITAGMGPGLSASWVYIARLARRTDADM